MPPPPELAGWINFITWGAVFFVIVIVAIVFTEYMFRWLRSLQPVRTISNTNRTTTYDDEGLRELLQEIKALRKEISELKHELSE